VIDAIKTVLFGAIGIRRKSDHEAARVRPAQIVIVAIVFLGLFILAIRTVVHLATS
jgi:hypothetical protein